MNLLTEFIVVSYIIIGLAYANKIPDMYFVITLFFLFKLIVNYRKCTLSYVECKLRNVKKEEGYIQNFLDNIVDVRYDENAVYIYMFMVYISFMYLYQQRKNINNMLFKK